MTVSRRDERALARWRRIDKGVAVVSALAFASFALAWMYWGVAMPPDADPSAGRIWALNYRGRVFYLLESQFALLMVLFALFVGAVISLVLIEAVIDPFQRRRGS